MVEQYWQAANRRDWSAFAALLHPEVIYEIPQTRERVCGRAACVDFNATYPGDWSVEIISLIADERQAVSRTVFRVNGASDVEAIGICFFEFQDGLIYRMADYWPAVYEPPARLSASVERY